MKHAELVTSSFQYQKVDAVVGLTLYMGAREYTTTLPDDQKNKTMLLLYAGCSAESTTNIDAVSTSTLSILKRIFLSPLP
ncbi:hypothetical protein V5799_031649 [Amblyomma americanum]|uniref:Uncharacterized protein n=1 Tax=Amblyomma americanum TaxID=6943 RepID=A0AAQ4DTF1_AMBAM